jgi:hypothetical protein
MTGARKPGSPRRARSSRSNHCVGNAGRFRCLRCEYSCAYSNYIARMRLRVHWAPGIPRALSCKGRNEFAKLGQRSRRETAQACLPFQACLLFRVCLFQVCLFLRLPVVPSRRRLSPDCRNALLSWLNAWGTRDSCRGSGQATAESGRWLMVIGLRGHRGVMRNC